MKNTETKLMYGSYHRHEIALLETVLSKTGAGYVISEKKDKSQHTVFHDWIDPQQRNRSFHTQGG